MRNSDNRKWIPRFLAFSLIIGLTACTPKPLPPEEVQVAPDSSNEAGSETPDTSIQQTEVHVASDGSDETGTGTPEKPYATVSRAAHEKPGCVIVVHGGTYGQIRLDEDTSGTEDSPTFIRPAEGEKVIVSVEGDKCISICNASHIVIGGIETEGGTHGIEYESTREAKGETLGDITIRKCTVHGVRGIHGINFYAYNDLKAVSDITIEDCEVYDCECGSSESVVLNGNIDGFLIAGNRIHDNNNIGIDMIGFEGLAVHPDKDRGRNPYEADQVRNGVCRDNVVYNISSEGNDAYFEDGEYDLCADGIYVDGGRDIEICNNFIFNCDIGLEVATEHSPEENELFKVSCVNVHDNVIADCTGWTGICFGGYDRDLGFTEDCEFNHNTLVDNSTQIGIQRSRNNRVYANLLIGGETGIEYSEDCREEDMDNDISDNAAAEIEDEDSWTDEYGLFYSDRGEISEGFKSLVEDVGSRIIPDSGMLDLYYANKSGRE